MMIIMMIIMMKRGMGVLAATDRALRMWQVPAGVFSSVGESLGAMERFKRGRADA